MRYRADPISTRRHSRQLTPTERVVGDTTGNAANSFNGATLLSVTSTPLLLIVGMHRSGTSLGDRAVTLSLIRGNTGSITSLEAG
jgi:hypothetical protein